MALVGQLTSDDSDVARRSRSVAVPEYVLLEKTPKKFTGEIIGDSYSPETGRRGRGFRLGQLRTNPLFHETRTVDIRSYSTKVTMGSLKTMGA
jgi:hypothetical protein